MDNNILKTREDCRGSIPVGTIRNMPEVTANGSRKTPFVYYFGCGKTSH